MAHHVRLEQLGSRPIAVVRRRASSRELGSVVQQACGHVWNVMRQQKIAGAGRHVALYLDGAINLEVGVELEAPFGGCGDVVDSSTPAGLVATTTQFGPYNRLGEAHEAIRAWCAANGHTAAGPQWEIYGHWIDEWNSNPALIRTDVFYLLRAGGGG